MAPNVTSTSLPCHSIRVWHRAEFNRDGSALQRCSRGSSPLPGTRRATRAVASPVQRELQPKAAPREPRGRGPPQGSFREAESPSSFSQHSPPSSWFSCWDQFTVLCTTAWAMEPRLSFIFSLPLPYIPISCCNPTEIDSPAASRPLPAALRASGI